MWHKHHFGLFTSLINVKLHLYNPKTVWTPVKQWADVVALCSCTNVPFKLPNISSRLKTLFPSVKKNKILSKNNVSCLLNSRFVTAIYILSVLWLFLNISPRGRGANCVDTLIHIFFLFVVPFRENSMLHQNVDAMETLLLDRFLKHMKSS